MPSGQASGLQAMSDNVHQSGGTVQVSGTSGSAMYQLDPVLSAAVNSASLQLQQVCTSTLAALYKTWMIIIGKTW